MKKSIISDLSPFNNKTGMSDARLTVKKLLSFVLCYIVGFGLAEGLVILLHFAIGLNVFEGETLSPGALTIVTVYGFIVPFAVTILYRLKIEKRSLAESGLAGKPLHWLLGGALGVLLLGLCVGGIMLTGAIRFDGINSPDASALITMFFGFLIQGFAEEAMTRGLVLGGLKDKVPLPAAIGASTLAFVLPHILSMTGGGLLLTLAGILNLVLISVIFSMLTLRTGSILAACGLHSVWNFILDSVLGLALSGSDETASALIDLRASGSSLLNGGAYGIEASVITAAVLGAAALCLILTAPKTKKGGE